MAYETDGKSKVIDEDLRTLLFRTVRELLINVVKHARAQKAKVSLKSDEKTIRVKVEDDGIGFSYKEYSFRKGKGGFGLFSIKERLHSLGGKMEFDPEITKGTRVVLTLPLRINKESEKEERDGS